LDPRLQPPPSQGQQLLLLQAQVLLQLLPQGCLGLLHLQVNLQLPDVRFVLLELLGSLELQLLECQACFPAAVACFEAP
jgi:hypothetical protein